MDYSVLKDSNGFKANAHLQIHLNRTTLENNRSFWIWTWRGRGNAEDFDLVIDVYLKSIIINPILFLYFV